MRRIGLAFVWVAGCGPSVLTDDASGSGDGGEDGSAGSIEPCWDVLLDGDAESMVVSETGSMFVAASVGREAIVFQLREDGTVERTVSARSPESDVPYGDRYHDVAVLPSGTFVAAGEHDRVEVVDAFDKTGAVAWSSWGDVRSTETIAWHPLREQLIVGGHSFLIGTDAWLGALTPDGTLAERFELAPLYDVWAIAPLGEGFVVCGTAPGFQGAWALAHYDANGEVTWRLDGPENGTMSCDDVEADGTRIVASVDGIVEGLDSSAYEFTVLSIIDGEIEWTWSGGVGSDIFRGLAVADDGTAYVIELSTPAMLHAIDRDGNERLSVPIDDGDRFPLDLAWHDGRLYVAGWAHDSSKDSPSYASCWNVGR